MKSNRFRIVAAVIVILAFGYYGILIRNAQGDALTMQLRMTQASARVDALEKRIQELEAAKASQDQRLSQLEKKN